MATLNGPAGADTLLSWGTYRAGYCLEAVSKALGAYHIPSDRPGYYTYALRAWETTPAAQRRYDRTPPKGAVVYLSAGANGYGHVCLSMGGGRIVSTDVPSNGRIGVTTIGDLERAWGRQFLGWAAYIMGHTVTVDGSASAPAPSGGGGSSQYPADAILRWKWTGIQRMLKKYYGYAGAIDNIAGDGSIGAMRRFLNGNGYSRRAIGRDLRSGRWDENEAKAIQVWLSSRSSNPYRGAIDGLPGPQTQSSWNTAEAENGAAFANVR